MFTQNYINMKEAEFLGKSKGIVIDYTGAEKSFYFTHTGNGSTNLRDIGYMLPYWVINPTNGGGLCIGKGATPPSRADYRLEEYFPENTYTVKIINVTEKDTENGKYSFISDLTVRNTGDTEMTIREIGIFTRLLIATGNYEAYATALMERTVLDEPVTIPAGESRLITYKLVFNHS